MCIFVLVIEKSLFDLVWVLLCFIVIHMSVGNGSSTSELPSCVSQFGPLSHQAQTRCSSFESLEHGVSPVTPSVLPLKQLAKLYHEHHVFVIIYVIKCVDQFL